MDLTRLKTSLKAHEGFRGKPYLDTNGFTTIGYGRNLDANPLSPEEGEILLGNDLARASEQAQRLVSNWADLSEARQGVLIEMVFNLGYIGVYGFHKMLAAIEEGDFTEAAAEMLDSKWATQVGHRALELAHQMTEGEWV